jgi:hypothetical protein
MRRATSVFLPALLALFVLIVPVAAVADSANDSRFVSYTNSARAAHGLHGYAVSSDLSALARRWAAHMAAHHQLAHNPSFTSQVCCWTQVGENVGAGGTASAIQRAFMASSPHRANILSTGFTQIGVGTARGSNGKLYVDELFRRPTHAAPRTAQAVHAAPVTVRHAASLALRTPARASRSTIRRPRLTAPHHPDGRVLFLGRLAAARRAGADGYADPVGGAVAYLRVVQQLSG